MKGAQEVPQDCAGSGLPSGTSLRSGQTLKDIWETLDEQGLDIGYHVFQMTIWRARRSKAAAASGGWEKGTKPSDSQDSPDADMPTMEARDPFANLKRLEANRPGFHRRATPTRKDSGLSWPEWREKNKRNNNTT
jgi:hypothetical protein